VKDVAWGAFTASQYHVVSAVPLLTAALGRELGADADARRVEALRPSLDRWPIPTLILLDNSIGDRDAPLLDRFSATSGFEWPSRISYSRASPLASRFDYLTACASD
jgi:hypothetical protein